MPVASDKRAKITGHVGGVIIKRRGLIDGVPRCSGNTIWNYFSCKKTFAKLHPSSKSPKIYNAPEDMRTYTHHRGHGIHYES